MPALESFPSSSGAEMPSALTLRLWERLKDQPVRVEQSYVAGGNAEAYLVPIGDFLKDYRWFAERGLMCPETLVPNLDADILAGLRQSVGTCDDAPTVLVHLGYPGSTRVSRCRNF